MIIFFDRDSGTLFLTDELKYDDVYSGDKNDYNNKFKEDEIEKGTIPAGLYQIGKAVDDPKMGPNAIKLTQFGDALLYGRSGFYIHGDNAQHDHSASCGCVIAPPAARQWIIDNQVKWMRVL